MLLNSRKSTSQENVSLLPSNIPLLSMPLFPWTALIFFSYGSFSESTVCVYCASKQISMVSEAKARFNCLSQFSHFSACVCVCAALFLFFSPCTEYRASGSVITSPDNFSSFCSDSFLCCHRAISKRTAMTFVRVLFFMCLRISNQPRLM